MTQATMNDSADRGAEDLDSPKRSFGFVWRWRLLLLFFLALGLIGGYLWHQKQVVVFVSRATLFFPKADPNDATSTLGMPNTGRSLDATHEQILVSELIASKAAADPSLAKFPGLSGPNGRFAVMAGLSANISSKDRLNNQKNNVDLTFTSLRPEEPPVVLQAVIKAYTEFLGETYDGVSKEAMELFESGRVSLEKQIKEAEGEYAKFLESIPDVLDTDTGLTARAARLERIESERSRRVLDAVALEATLSAFEKAIEQDLSVETLNLMAVRFSHSEFNSRERRAVEGRALAGSTTTPASPTPLKPDPELETKMVSALRVIDSMEQQRRELRTEESILKEKYGESYPKVRGLRRRLEMLDQFLEKERDDLDRLREQKLDIERANEEAVAPASATEEVAEPKRPIEEEPFALYIATLREEIKMNQSNLRDLDDLYAQEKQVASNLANWKFTNESHKSEVDRKKRLFETVLKRLDELSLLRSAVGVRMWTTHSPSAPVPRQVSLATALAIGAVLASLLGLSAAYLLEMLDNRFLGPEDVGSALRAEVVSHIPRFSASRSKKATGHPELAPSLLANSHPLGVYAEACRAVRTSLLAAGRDSKMQVVQVTSPCQGDGKTTLASNLAVCYAQTGKRTLLIDADLRRPAVHGMFGLKNEAGLAQVLNAGLEPTDAIVASAVKNLFIMPSGELPPNPAELLCSEELGNLLESLREKFTTIIVDTPPVLAVTDPLSVAGRVDGVVVVLQLNARSRTLATNCFDLLRSVNAPIHGVAINGMSRSGFLGGYQGYGYARYSYRGHYGVGSYGTRDFEGYYSNDSKKADRNETANA